MAPAVPTPDHIRQMLDALPDDGSEIVVRVDEQGSTTVTVRGSGTPPQVYTASGTALLPLDPAQDERLPGSSLLADRVELGKKLGLGERGLREVQLVRYRPCRRAVARVVTEPDGGVLYLKLLTRKGYRKAESVLRSLEPTAGTVQLMLPCRWLSKARILVAEEARGTALQDLIVDGHEIDLEQLAQAIRSFASAAPPASLPVRTLESEREAALTAIRRGVRVLPEIDELSELVSDATSPASTRDSLLHTDLHAKQIFIDGATVRLIDLEGVSRGDWRLDVVYLSEHLCLRALQLGEGDRLEGYARDLLVAFGLQTDDEFARVAGGLIKARFAGIYALRPRRIEITRKLADAARAALK